MTDDNEVDRETYTLRNISNGEEITREWTEAEMYEAMNDDMLFEIGIETYERVFKDRSYFDFNRNRGAASNICVWTKPLTSVAAGVHPSQAKEFTQAARDAGFTGVSFNSEGDAEFTTRRQRSKYLKHVKMCDREAGYSD